jgi:hypothetical protein
MDAQVEDINSGPSHCLQDVIRGRPPGAVTSNPQYTHGATTTGKEIEAIIVETDLVHQPPHLASWPQI